MQVIKVSLDGGSTYQIAPQGVRIVYEDVLLSDDEGRGEVHINATTEGLITDVLATRESPLDTNLASRAEQLGDIIFELIGDE